MTKAPLVSPYKEAERNNNVKFGLKIRQKFTVSRFLINSEKRNRDVKCIFFKIVLTQLGKEVEVVVTNLFADTAPGIVKNRVLITRYRGVQLLQHNLHTAVAVCEPTDVVHHGSLTEHVGALV